jgi:hypothetical protein
MTTPAQEAHTTLRSRRRRPAGRSPAARLCLVCVAVAATLLATAAAAQSSGSRLVSPSRSEIGRAGSAIRDSVLHASAVPSVVRRTSEWGGPITASNGEQVTIFFSNSYPQDPALAQQWANFLASLAHGSELSQLISHIAPLAEVERVCGSQALACYSPGRNTLYAPGEDPAFDISAEAVITHEYGHHVANHRSNAPWSAEDYGTKRWASYEQICRGTAHGELFPGAEDASHYQLNPGEAFAETYRVLNQRKAGVAETPWDIVTQALYPDNTALALLEQDVLQPWTTTTTRARTGSVTAKAKTRTFSLPTPLDGQVRITLRTPARGRLALDVYTSSSPSSRVAHATGTGSVTVATTVCGPRTLRVRVSRITGAGTVRLALATP